jgi:hypothetical protein
MRALPLLVLAGSISCTSAPAPRSTATATATANRTTAVPPIASPLPYDLPSDLEARISTARKDFGAKTTTQIESGVFVVTGPGAPGTLPFLHKVLGALFHDRFQKRPVLAVSVYMFADARPYDAFCKKRWDEACMSPFGFYQPGERIIVMNAGPGIGTLSHEIVHPIVETDFPKAPDWLNEGLASLFEAPVMPREGEIHGAKNWRWPRLASALASKKDEARLDALFGMSDDTFRGDGEDLHYAMARYACQWLDAHGQLWPFYKAWRDGVADDADGVKAFSKIVGASPAAANATWGRWVRAL